MNQLLSIVDDKLVINKLRIEWTEGSLTHAGSLNVTGLAKFDDNVELTKDISVAGTIVADTINVKHIICDEKGGANDPLAFTANTEKELDGRGLQFVDGNAVHQFIYKVGGKFWTNQNLEIAKNNKLIIDGAPVVSFDTLGPTVTSSNLKQVGTLKELTVSGPMKVGGFAYFNESLNRLGLNTEAPNATLAIQDNGVEIILGSQKNETAAIGTYTSSNLEIITDNVARITVAKDGEVVIGHPKFKNGVLRVHGTLHVTDLVADTRLERSTPLEFKGTKDNSIYGKGIIWSGQGSEKQFIYSANPDRITSTDSIDLAVGKYFAVNGKVVLGADHLGNDVIYSSLTRLGVLETLKVSGSSEFDTLSASAVYLGSSEFRDSRLNVNSRFEIQADHVGEFVIDANGSITVGNSQNKNRKVSIFGTVGIGVNNPESGFGLTVAGPVSIDDKKFIKGSAIPTDGVFNKGDICWNTEPLSSSYIGWVCIVSGTPGQWKPFGLIG